MAKLKGGTRVYGSAVIDAALTATDVTILGNLNIKGTTTTIDTSVSTVKDPVITLGADANGVAIQDGLDRGLILRYNDGVAKDGFMGWDQTNGEFALAATTTFDSANNSVAITSYGNVHAAHFVGEGDTLGNITGANVTGTVRNANMSAFAETVTGASQSNITSLGTLTSVSVSGATNLATINANGVVTFSDTTASGSSTTGALTVAGGAGVAKDLYVGGNIYGNFAGDIAAKGSDTQVQFNDAGKQNATSGFTFNKSTNALTATGTITGGNLSTGGTATVTGTATVGNLSTAGTVDATGTATVGNLSTAGTIDATGTATVGSLSTAGTVSATGNVSGGNFVTAGDVTTATVTASGNISTTASLNVTQDAIITGSANAAGGFTTGANIDGTGASSTLNIKNIVATGTANITGTATAGNVSTAGRVDATGTITGGDLTTVGRVSTANLTITGLVTGNLVPASDQSQDLGSETSAWKDLWLSGNSIRIGTQTISSSTTGVAVSNALSVTDLVASNSVSAVTMTASGAITGANVTANNLSTTQVVFANGSTLTSAAGFTYASDTLTTQNVSVTSNASVTGTLNVTGATTLTGLTAADTTVANLTAGASTLNSASITTTLNVTGATTLAGLTANATTVGTLAAGATTITGTASVSDTATVGNLSTAGTVTATGSVTAGSFSTAGNATVSGTVNTPNVSATNSLSVTSLNGGITLSASTGVIDASAGRLTNLASPTQASDAATKGYVDASAQGLDVKNSVRAATTSNITLTGAQTIDAVSVVNGDRVLVKNQTTASENGIYVVGTPWTRSLDTNETGKITGGTFTFIEEGSYQHDSGWVVNTDGVITVGTSAISWTQFSGAGQLSAEHGISLTGAVFSAVTDDSTIEVGAGNALRVKDGLTLVTPNIGAATGSSLNLGTGLVTGNGSALFSINGGNVSEVALATHVTAADQANITSVGTLTSLAVSGNVNIGTGTVVANTGIYTDGYYYANGAAIDFQTAAGDSYQIQFHKDGANDLDASANLTFSASSELSVTGTANVSGLVTAGNIVDSSLTSGQLTFAGASKELTGDANLTFASGTLTTVTANVTTLNAANITATSLTSSRVTFAGVNGALKDNANLTFSGTELAVTGTANVSGTVTAGNIVDSSLTAGRVTFAGANGLLSDDAGLQYADGELQAANANVAGYITGANVTARNLSTAGRIVLAGSGGLLSDDTNLSFVASSSTLSTGNVSATGTVSAAYVSGDGSALSSITGANVTGQVGNALVAGTVYSAAQANITSVGTLTSVTVSGASDLGAVGNVKITGGTTGQYLKTDGSGLLSFASIDLTKIENGSSSVSIPVADGDISITRGGTLTLAITGTGANVTGILNVSGNVNANNITAASSISVTDGADATNAASGALTVTGGIAASGNIYTGHSVGFANNNGGTDSKAYIQFNSTANSLDFIFN